MDRECSLAPDVLKVSSAGLQDDGETPPAHHIHWPRKAAVLSRMYPKKMHAGQRNDFTSASCQHLYKFAWIELACRVRQQVSCSASTVTNASGDHFKKFTHNRAMLFPSEKILNPDPNVPSNTYILTQTQGHCQHASCHFAAKNKRVKELDAGYPESNENRSIKEMFDVIVDMSSVRSIETKSARTVGAKGRSGGANTVSFSWGGGLFCR